jgi:hypothetical protein
MGAGKTTTGLGLAMNFDFDKVIITPPALDTPWREEFSKIGISGKDEAKFSYYNYEELSKYGDGLYVILKNKIVIFDEAHWLLRYRDKPIIVKLQQALKNSRRVFLFTGTPVQTDLSDLGFLINQSIQNPLLPSGPSTFKIRYEKTTWVSWIAKFLSVAADSIGFLQKFMMVIYGAFMLILTTLTYGNIGIAQLAAIIGYSIPMIPFASVGLTVNFEVIVSLLVPMILYIVQLIGPSSIPTALEYLNKFSKDLGFRLPESYVVPSLPNIVQLTPQVIEAIKNDDLSKVYIAGQGQESYLITNAVKALGGYAGLSTLLSVFKFSFKTLSGLIRAFIGSEAALDYSLITKEMAPYISFYDYELKPLTNNFPYKNQLEDRMIPYSKYQDEYYIKAASNKFEDKNEARPMQNKLFEDFLGSSISFPTNRNEFQLKARVIGNINPAIKYYETYTVPKRNEFGSRIYDIKEIMSPQDYLESISPKSIKKFVLNHSSGASPQDISTLETVKFPPINPLQCIKFDEVYEEILDYRSKHHFLPLVYSNFDEFGFKLFGAYLTRLGVTYIAVDAEDEIEQRLSTLAYANEPYKLLGRQTNTNLIQKYKDYLENSLRDAKKAKNEMSIRIITAQLQNFLSRKEKERTPLCILLHPTIKEGYSFTFAPVMMILETPHGYGNREQIYARILRTMDNTQLALCREDNMEKEVVDPIDKQTKALISKNILQFKMGYNKQTLNIKKTAPWIRDIFPEIPQRFRFGFVLYKLNDISNVNVKDIENLASAGIDVKIQNTRLRIKADSEIGIGDVTMLVVKIAKFFLSVVTQYLPLPVANFQRYYQMVKFQWYNDKRPVGFEDFNESLQVPIRALDSISEDEVIDDVNDLQEDILFVLKKSFKKIDDEALLGNVPCPLNVARETYNPCSIFKCSDDPGNCQAQAPYSLDMEEELTPQATPIERKRGREEDEPVGGPTKRTIYRRRQSVASSNTSSTGASNPGNTSLEGGKKRSPRRSKRRSKGRR